MNGHGWVCDECGKTEVVAGDPFVNAHPAPPTGWYLLYKAPPGRAQENERWEFCSVACIHAQTQERGPMRYVDPPTHLSGGLGGGCARCGRRLESGDRVTTVLERVTCDRGEVS